MLSFYYVDKCYEDYTSATNQANIYPWPRLPHGTQGILFRVRTQDNAHIGLATDQDDSTVLAEVGRLCKRQWYAFFCFYRKPWYASWQKKMWSEVRWTKCFLPQEQSFQTEISLHIPFTQMSWFFQFFMSFLRSSAPCSRTLSTPGYGFQIIQLIYSLPSSFFPRLNNRKGWSYN